jgi:excisionase family DNA binding protein
MTKIPTAENCLNVKEAAKALRASPFAVRDWVKQGKIAVYRIGGRFYFAPEDIETFLEKSRTEAKRHPSAPRAKCKEVA